MAENNDKARELEEFRAEEVFHRREWFVQRTGWTLLGVLILAACAGLFGNGPLAHQQLPIEGNVLDIDRFARREAASEWVFRPQMSTDRHDEFAVRISSQFLEHYRIVTIIPEPRQQVIDKDDVLFRFAADRSGSVITFNVEPLHMGWSTGEFRIGHSSPVRVRQLVYP
jgi:hypothetical protein